MRNRLQIVTLQELVVLACALDLTAAELIVPPHIAAPGAIDASPPFRAYSAAQRLFAIPRSGRLDRWPTTDC